MPRPLMSPSATAASWLAAWNAHDLDAILAHYTDDVEFRSPLVVKLLGDPSGTVRGKEALQAYFARALEAAPTLRFDRLEVFEGVGSATLCYWNATRGVRVAEVHEFDARGRIRRGSVHHLRA